MYIDKLKQIAKTIDTNIIDITGYQFEPWHLRYVGQDLATELKDLDITLEEYYDLYLN